MALSIAGVCVLTGAFGSNVAIRRSLPTGQASRANYQNVTYILFGPVIVILTGVLFAVIAYVDPSFGRWEVGLAFIAYGVSLFFSNQALDFLNALGLVRVSARVNAIGSMACLALVAAFALLQLQLEWFIAAYAISAMAQVLMSIVIVGRTQTPAAHSAVPGATLRLIRDGGRLLGLNLGQSLTFRGDTILLGVLSSQAQVGNYAVAITPAAILRIPANALGQVIFHRSAVGGIRTGALFGRIAIVMLCMSPLIVIGWLTADWLFPLVFGPGYEAAAWPFRFLLIAELSLVPFLILARALAGDGSTWGASACGIVGVVILGVACVILIPSLGAVGAAVASCLAYGSMSGLAIVLTLLRRRAAAEPVSD